MSVPDDPYSRVDYRRFVAWPERIRREWPFLERVLATAPSRRVLDLGCGTGEHARFLASAGYAVVGIDASDSMVVKAREVPSAGHVEFVAGDMADVRRLTAGSFGAALCLGNTLPHIRDGETLARFLAGLRARLLPDAPFVLQILNYERIFRTAQRFLPLNFRTEDQDQIVFLRLMQLKPDGMVMFTPSTLRYRPDGEPPLEVVASHNVLLRGWTQPDLDRALGTAGFDQRSFFGTVGEAPYVPSESVDCVIVAR